MKYLLLLLLTGACLSLTTDKPTRDYLGVGELIEFNDKSYRLAWSSNPLEGYYKQEYLTDSTTLENFNELFMVEAIKGDISPNDAANVKVSELQEWKKSNPVVNWNVYEKEEGRIIDFVVTDGGFVYEWNIYRYLTQKNKKKKFLLLYAYSYKDSVVSTNDLKVFFDRIVENRNTVIAKLGELELPLGAP
ncbi:MAG TPA: hypothetical protein VK151_17400 [Fluviicola sp.]|nr:hypothetical protein [Fluviicola sp.]